MRVRIHRPEFNIDFQGSPGVWNALLRPIFGGPEAPPDPVPPPPSAAPVTGSATTATAVTGPAPVVRTFAPPPSGMPAAPTTTFSASPAPTSGVRTYYPPREPRDTRDVRDSRAPRAGRDAPRQARDDDRPNPAAPWRRRGGPEPEARIEPSTDPAEVYSRLEALGSRRAEKDAVLAAVWFVGGGEREVHEKEITAHFEAHGGPVDAKVRPQLLKHINRTKLLEQGTKTGLVRLTGKGREHVRLLCGV